MTKIIWFLWLQGETHMPKQVRLCYDSWRIMNSDYQLIFLDRESVKQYIDISPILKVQKHLEAAILSDIIRINLLNKYGGVWVDATAYCAQPLSSWLDSNFESGFFAFSRPDSRMISSWFLAAQPKNKLVEIYADHFNRYWLRDKNKRYLSSTKFGKLFKFARLDILLHKRPSIWTSFIFREILKVYPYYCFHYFFNTLYKSNPTFRDIWDHSSKISALPQRETHAYEANDPASPKLKHAIENSTIPVYKLTRTRVNPHIKNSNYNYLRKIISPQR